MGKETKIGLAVVGTLLIVFCGVLYKRVSKLKTTPASVAKAESKADEKKGLFDSPTKLAAQPADDDAAVADPPSAGRWNSASSESTAKQSGSPPSRSFLPADDEPIAPPAVGSRYAQTEEPSEEPAESNEAIKIAEPVADNSETSTTEESAPSTVANPFARSTPTEMPTEAATPAAVEPEAVASEEPETAGADEAPIGHVVGNESDAPARLDENAVPAAAMSDEPAPPQEAYARPTSRFITPQDDEPAAPPTPRYRTSAAAPSAVAAATREEQSVAGGSYKLGPNENFWTVSEKAYGSGGYFKALHAYNAEKFPVADELTVGDEVQVPLRAELERQFPELCPKAGRRPVTKSYAVQASAKMKPTGNSYVVQEGDTLFDIARYELGKASRWAELYDLNRDVIGDDIDFLRAGMELVLPDDEGKADAVTRQPAQSLQR